MNRYVWGALLIALLIACQAPAPRSGERGAQPPPAEAGSAAAARAEPASAAPLQVVRVGTVGSATDSVHYWAQERGYLREEGLDVEITVFDGAQRMIAPLGADQLDVGSGAPGPGLFNAILRGVNFYIVAGTARAVPGTRFNCLVVRKALLDSGAVRSFADFRGRVFAENVPGVVTTYLVERELRRAGVSPEEVTFVTLSFPDMLSAFANEAADAGVQVEPFITLGEQRGLSQCWKPTSELQPDFQIAVMLYSPAFAEQRAEAARRFMVAYLRGARDYYRAFFGDGQGREEFLQLMARVTAVRDVELLARLNPSWSDPNGVLNVETLRDVQRWYIGRGEQLGEVDLDKVIDTRFVNYAFNRLGRYPVP